MIVPLAPREPLAFAQLGLALFFEPIDGTAIGRLPLLRPGAGTRALRTRGPLPICAAGLLAGACVLRPLAAARGGTRLRLPARLLLAATRLLAATKLLAARLRLATRAVVGGGRRTRTFGRLEARYAFLLDLAVDQLLDVLE